MKVFKTANYKKTAVEHFPDNYNISYVSVYEVTREYGGPEEGGWWYNEYTLIDSRLVSIDEEAYLLYDFLNIKYNTNKAINIDNFKRELEFANEDIKHTIETYQISNRYEPGSKILVTIEKKRGEREEQGPPHYE